MNFDDSDVEIADYTRERQGDESMKNEIFAELLDSAHEMVEHAQGKRKLRTMTLSIPPKPLRRRDAASTARVTPARSSRQRSRETYL